MSLKICYLKASSSGVGARARFGGTGSIQPGAASVAFDPSDDSLSLSRMINRLFHINKFDLVIFTNTSYNPFISVSG